MNFLAEPPPPHDAAVPVLPGIRRLVASNPGPMTYRGTNSYLLDWEGGAAVLDPGPDDAAHVARLIAAAGAPIRAILLTHGHLDHRGALPALRAETGAPLYAFDPALAPDIRVQDGDRVGAWTALHTPGHAPDHLCFAQPGGVVFSGDHVMSWSTTVVAGPNGDMAAYFASLEKLVAVPASAYLPGHGPMLPDPVAFARDLLRYRQDREQMLLQALAGGAQTIPSLLARLYPGVAPSLARPAEGNLRAHLRKLEQERRIAAEGERWTLAAQG